MFLDSDSNENQIALSDRAMNPTRSDVSRLYSEWQKKELGEDNGKALFDKLSSEITAYNDSNSEVGGKAMFQCFKSTVDSFDEDDDNDVDCSANVQQPWPRRKKQKKEKNL